MSMKYFMHANGKNRNILKFKVDSRSFIPSVESRPLWVTLPEAK